MRQQTPQKKHNEKTHKMAEAKIQKILMQIGNFKLNSLYVSKLNIKKSNKELIKDFYRNYLINNVSKKHMVVFAVFSIIVLGHTVWSLCSRYLDKQCLLELPSSSKTIFRPPENCAICMDVENIVKLSNISAKEFEARYAYGTTPVIVTDAMTNWKSVKEFDFNFFAKFYKDFALGKQINECFYFAYKSGFNSLTEVFNMETERANLSYGDPWYVGWSTCFDEETRKLREYYNRPYFLPETAESDMVDWIFMGGPGQGAHMHVDSVRHVSWQAQVRGSKRWTLAPPPECLYQCKGFSFDVTPGDILVVDTNRWYHQTTVLPGDISITIGAEYD